MSIKSANIDNPPSTNISSGGQLVDVSIEQELQTSYLAYAMSVIVSRAIPDVRDGLKPVQRRILYAMHDLNFSHNKPHKKSAKVIGEVIAKYHPHGDGSIYDALVRLAQDFSMGMPLIDGQGNFGSIDADPPAAMRYTEVRLQKITHTMLADLSKNTVLFRDNYDGSEFEPTILPSAFPQILANGSEGIAVGMATNTPPYNLGEVIDACLRLIETPNISDEELSSIIPGPDFPTGSTIVNAAATAKASLSGRGSVVVKGKAEIVELRNNRNAIIITEIPFQVVKSRLIEKIGELVRDKRIEGISSLRDESNKCGIRVVVELKREASGQVVLNQIYKLTPLQANFSINSLLLHNNRPEIMGLRDVILSFLEFRISVIKKRLEHELLKVRERSHMLIGLHVTIDSIDEIISIIRNSIDHATAKATLMEKSWPVEESMIKLFELVDDYRNKIENNQFSFTEDQVKAILDMRLAKLTGLERDRIIIDLQEAGKQMCYYLSTIADQGKIKAIAIEELKAIKDEFAIPRRTSIIEGRLDSSIEDFIEPENVLITMTNNGYMKRSSLDNCLTQKRGGKGKIGFKIREGDEVAKLLVSHTHNDIMLFSDMGIVHKIKAYNIPAGSVQSQGRAVANLITLRPGELVSEVLSVSFKKVTEGDSLIFATKCGNIRKSSILDFEKVRSNGKIAIELTEDRLIGVSMATDKDDILLATKKGIALRFSVKDLRVIKSRSSDGVKGISLDNGDEVISMSILHHIKEDSEIKDLYLSIPLKDRLKMHTLIIDQNPESLYKCEQICKQGKLVKDGLSLEQICKMAEKEQFILTVNSAGFAKRTSAYEYRITKRAGKGIKNMNLALKSFIVASFIADVGDDIILTSSKGKLIRCNVKSIPIIGRSTKGVKTFNVNKETVVSVARVLSSDWDDTDLSDEKKSTDD
ncbi:MAG: DNA gyrase subunit A [Alphaproteobacteria bacterium]|nr:DNA gyrase subunit A [Rickettsiales bacterium]